MAGADEVFQMLEEALGKIPVELLRIVSKYVTYRSITWRWIANYPVPSDWTDVELVDDAYIVGPNGPIFSVGQDGLLSRVEDSSVKLATPIIKQQVQLAFSQMIGETSHSSTQIIPVAPDGVNRYIGIEVVNSTLGIYDGRPPYHPIRRVGVCGKRAFRVGEYLYVFSTPKCHEKAGSGPSIRVFY